VSSKVRRAAVEAAAASLQVEAAGVDSYGWDRL
jgi:hypothetical protein